MLPTRQKYKGRHILRRLCFPFLLSLFSFQSLFTVVFNFFKMVTAQRNRPYFLDFVGCEASLTLLLFPIYFSMPPINTVSYYLSSKQTKQWRKELREYEPSFNCQVLSVCVSLRYVYKKKKSQFNGSQSSCREMPFIYPNRGRWGPGWLT